MRVSAREVSAGLEERSLILNLHLSPTRTLEWLEDRCGRGQIDGLPENIERGWQLDVVQELRRGERPLGESDLKALRRADLEGAAITDARAGQGDFELHLVLHIHVRDVDGLGDLPDLHTGETG